MCPLTLCRERPDRIQSILSANAGSLPVREFPRTFSVWIWEIEQAAALGWLKIETRKPRTGRPSRIVWQELAETQQRNSRLTAGRSRSPSVFSTSFLPCTPPAPSSMAAANSFTCQPSQTFTKAFSNEPQSAGPRRPAQAASCAAVMSEPHEHGITPDLMATRHAAKPCPKPPRPSGNAFVNSEAGESGRASRLSSNDRP